MKSVGINDFHLITIPSHMISIQTLYPDAHFKVKSQIRVDSLKSYNGATPFLIFYSSESIEE